MHHDRLTQPAGAGEDFGEAMRTPLYDFPSSCLKVTPFERDCAAITLPFLSHPIR